MATRGKVKDVKIDPMGYATGTVTDTSGKIDYTFEQPYGKQLGLAINTIVQFETISIADKTIAVALDPVEKASIASIDYSTNSGVLVDQAGNKIPFEQNYAKELGLAEGTQVKYVSVSVDGQMRATSLKASGNP